MHVSEERSGGLFNCVSVCGEERRPAGLCVRRGKVACVTVCEERTGCPLACVLAKDRRTFCLCVRRGQVAC